MLPRLIAAGCRLNILFMDAAQCARSFANPEERPRLAGREYTLVPVSSTGAFHSKITMLLGARRSLLFVGSHNTTITGFGINRELTNFMDIRQDSTAEERANLRDAWEHLRSWAGGQADPILRIFHSFEHYLQPFVKKIPKRTVSHFEASHPAKGSLWESCRKRIKGKARQVMIMGPFFDSRLRFLQKVKADLQPEELIVGIQPKTASLNTEEASKLTDVRFVDLESFGRGTGYLHAKAMLIQMEDGSSYLLTGSANPSAPAWLHEKRRNAEAVILRYFPQGEESSFLNISHCLEVSTTAWSEVGTAKPNMPRLPKGESSRVLLVFAKEFGFVFANSYLQKHTGSTVQLIDGKGAVLFEATLSQLNDGLLGIRVADQKLILQAMLLRIVTEDLRYTAIIHHQAMLQRRALPPKQRVLAEAIDSLDGEAPRFEELLSLAFNVIFDVQIDKEHHHQPKKSHASKTKVVPKAMASLEDDSEVFGSNNRQRVATDSLIYLVEALTRSLSDPSASGHEANAFRSLNEEEISLLEDDSEDQPQNYPDPPKAKINRKALLKACHSKLNKMVNKMLARLDGLAKGNHSPTAIIRQLAAVLALLFAVQDREKHLPWLPEDTGLLPPQACRKLFESTCGYLLSWRNPPIQSAMEELKQSPGKESLIALGLMVWLARQCDVDVRNIGLWTRESVGERQKRYLDIARLIRIIRFLMPIPKAVDEARKWIVSSDDRLDREEAEAWFDALYDWGTRVHGWYRDSSSLPIITRRPKIGDMVSIKRQIEKTIIPMISVVLGNEAGNTRIANLDNPAKPSSKYRTESVKVIDAARQFSNI